MRLHTVWPRAFLLWPPSILFGVGRLFFHPATRRAEVGGGCFSESGASNRVSGAQLELRAKGPRSVDRATVSSQLFSRGPISSHIPS